MPTEPTSIEPPLAESKTTDDGVCDHVDGAESEHCGERDAADPDDDRISALERRVTELEAELEAVRGLLDGVETVDQAVERRAAAALAKAEALEERFAPENDRLVRERLPETAADRRQERTESQRTNRQRDRGSRDSGERSRAADRPGSNDRGSARTVGRGRTHPEDEDATDEGAVGSGAISSVGSGGSDEDVDDPDRPLAARLRDAFR